MLTLGEHNRLACCWGGSAEACARKLLAAALACMLSLMLVLLAVPACAFALQPPDTSKNCTLSAECLAAGKAITGLRLSLYRVASFGSDGNFELTESYQASGVDVGAPSKASEWAEAAAKLECYTQDNSLLPFVTAASSSAGVVSFSSLPAGLYLATSATGYVGDTPYSCAAFLVSVPGQAAGESDWNYHVAVEPKFQQGEITPSETGTATLPSILGKTGDGPQLYLAAALFFGALVLVVVCWLRRPDGQRTAYETQ